MMSMISNYWIYNYSKKNETEDTQTRSDGLPSVTSKHRYIMNLYPKSQVFRKNYARDSPSGSPKNHHMIGTQAGKQGLQPNLCNQESTGLVTLLKGLMDPNTQPEPNTPNLCFKGLETYFKIFNP